MRQLLYRISRKLYSRCRLESVNDPNKNGEYWLLSVLASEIERQPILFDIGANLGDWTKQAAAHFGRKFPHANYHCFEPCKSTREMLAKQLNSLSNIIIHPEGVSSVPGAAIFYSNSAGSGTNSLAPSSGSVQEAVKITTIDSIVESLPNTEPIVVKVDVEGFDYMVLEGGLQTLKSGRVIALQFEYNWRWLQNGRSLYDVFRLTKSLPYHIHKITPHQLIRFDDWHFELDRFFEANYLLLNRNLDLSKWTSKGHFDRQNTLQLN
jgi:FkbM family methyltransferase